MKTTESIKEIAQALVKAQSEIKAAIKESQNPFFKNRYADLASVIEAVRGPLNKAGICFLQPASTVPEGVAVETILLHTSGEWVSETLVMPVNKQDAQALGSATTYGRRYGLQSLCGVPSEDDDGEAAVRGQSVPKAAVTPTAGAWESLDEKTQSRLTDLLQVVKEYATDGDMDAANKVLDDADLGAEEKTGLWSKLDSKTRSALKRARQEAALRLEGQI